MDVIKWMTPKNEVTPTPPLLAQCQSLARTKEGVTSDHC